jgi:hypothetical protein
MTDVTVLPDGVRTPLPTARRCSLPLDAPA